MGRTLLRTDVVVELVACVDSCVASDAPLSNTVGTTLSDVREVCLVTVCVADEAPSLTIVSEVVFSPSIFKGITLDFEPRRVDDSISSVLTLCEAVLFADPSMTVGITLSCIVEVDVVWDVSTSVGIICASIDATSTPDSCVEVALAVEVEVLRFSALAESSLESTLMPTPLPCRGNLVVKR